MGANYGELKGEKSQSKIVSTVLSKRSKEKPTFHQIKKAGKGQVAIIRLIILETVFTLAEAAGTLPFPKAGGCGFYHHAKGQELLLKGSWPPVWVHSLYDYQCLRDNQDTDWTNSEYSKRH